jgi:hypothetical protein
VPRGILSASWRTVSVAVSLAFLLAGCATRQAVQPAPGQSPAARPRPARQVGQAYAILPARSRLIVLVYRAGPLAALGHNHVVACRCVTGTVYLPRDPLRASFEARVAVEQLSVDDPALRAAEHSGDFPPDVPPSARQGTRRHMLGAAQLNAARHPDITLRSEDLRPSPDGKRGDVVADVLVGLDGARHSVSVPMDYVIQGREIVVTGEFPLRQTDLGLAPYSVMGGALRVRDTMEVRLRLVAKRRG